MSAVRNCACCRHPEVTLSETLWERHLELHHRLRNATTPNEVHRLRCALVDQVRYQKKRANGGITPARNKRPKPTSAPSSLFGGSEDDDSPFVPLPLPQAQTQASLTVLPESPLHLRVDKNGEVTGNSKSEDELRKLVAERRALVAKRDAEVARIHEQHAQQLVDLDAKIATAVSKIY